MRKVHLALVTLVLFGSLTLIAWGVWPAPLQTLVLDVTPGQMMLAAPLAGIPETRRLTLQFPTSVRLGDSGVIKLSLETEGSLASNSLTAVSTAQETAGQAATVPNIYQTHNVIAEADADLPGVQTRPSGPVSEPLLPGESITFLWSVRALEPATYRGTVWLFLNFVDKVTGARTRLALAAPSVQIQAAGLLGLGGGAARVAGVLSLGLAIAAGFPFAAPLFGWLRA